MCEAGIHGRGKINQNMVLSVSTFPDIRKRSPHEMEPSLVAVDPLSTKNATCACHPQIQMTETLQ
jgi:hypothetical protein